jgi:hypothetical protein
VGKNLHRVLLSQKDLTWRFVLWKLASYASNETFENRYRTNVESGKKPEVQVAKIGTSNHSFVTHAEYSDKRRHSYTQAYHIGILIFFVLLELTIDVRTLTVARLWGPRCVGHALNYSWRLEVAEGVSSVADDLDDRCIRCCSRVDCPMWNVQWTTIDGYQRIQKKVLQIMDTLIVSASVRKHKVHYFAAHHSAACCLWELRKKTVM